MDEKTRIFIVEDEKRIARFLQMELEHEGFVTATESNGRRAYERILQENYDLVLLDLMLPEMDGLTICQNVRKLSDIPIIMLTSKDDLGDKVQGLDIGPTIIRRSPLPSRSCWRGSVRCCAPTNRRSPPRTGRSS